MISLALAAAQEAGNAGAAHEDETLVELAGVVKRDFLAVLKPDGDPLDDGQPWIGRRGAPVGWGVRNTIHLHGCFGDSGAAM